MICCGEKNKGSHGDGACHEGQSLCRGGRHGVFVCARGDKTKVEVLDAVRRLFSKDTKEKGLSGGWEEEKRSSIKDDGSSRLMVDG